MKVPVIIPAKNEEAFIGECLRSIDASSMYPLVVVNDSSDRTGEIARSFGAETHCIEEAGKVPAIQHGLRSIGTVAVSGFAILDADSRHAFGSRWLSAARSATLNRTPSMISGPLLWEGQGGRSVLTNLLRSIRTAKRVANDDSTVYEANMFFANLTGDILDDLIHMDHVFPGEGVEMRRMIRDEFDGHYRLSRNLLMLATTSDRYLRVRKPNEHWLDSYRARAPHGSVVPKHLRPTSS